MSKIEQFAKEILPQSILSELEKEEVNLADVKESYNSQLKEIVVKNISLNDVPTHIKDQVKAQLKQDDKSELGKTFGIAQRALLKGTGYSSKDVADHFDKDSNDLVIEEYSQFLQEKLKEDAGLQDNEWKAKYEAEQQKRLQVASEFEQKLQAKAQEVEDAKNNFEQYKIGSTLNNAKSNLFATAKRNNTLADFVEQDYFNLKLEKHLASKGWKEGVDENGNYVITNQDGTKIDNGKEILKTGEIVSDFIVNSPLYKKGDNGSGGSLKPTHESAPDHIAKQMASVKFGS